MRGFARIGTVLVALAACCSSARVFAFEITLDAGIGALTIVDNDGNDLNPAADVIDLSATVGGILAADARVTQFLGPIGRGITVGSRIEGGEGVFRNLDSATHAFTVTIEGDPFAPPGPALGWGVFLNTLADDTTMPTPADVEIPTNDLTLRIDPGDQLLSTVSAPVTPPVAAGGQPVSLDQGIRAVDPAGDATRVRVLWSFSAGPFDEQRLPDGSGLFASVFNAQDKCVVRMNKGASTVAKAAEADDAKCLATALRAGGADVTACVDDGASAKMTKAEARLLSEFPIVCGVPPAFAANLGTCCEGGVNNWAPCTSASDCPGSSCMAGACISAAAELISRVIAHDLFGATVAVADGATLGKCQQKVAKAVAKVHDARWKALVNCKRLNISALATEAAFVSTCLGPPQPTSPLVTSAQLYLDRTVQRGCLDKGVSGLAAVFPGACASEPDAGQAACLGRRVACRFCEEVTLADDIIAPLDCDVADDGTVNGTCP